MWYSSETEISTSSPKDEEDENAEEVEKKSVTPDEDQQNGEINGENNDASAAANDSFCCQSG